MKWRRKKNEKEEKKKIKGKEVENVKTSNSKKFKEENN